MSGACRDLHLANGSQRSRRFGYLIAVVLAMAACHGRNGEPSYVRGGPRELDESALHPLVLHGRLVTAGEFFGRPTMISVDRDHIWVGDEAGSPFVHLIDRATGALTISFGRKGDGPGDFGALVGLIHRPGDASSIWGIDVSLQRVMQIDTEPRHIGRTIPFSSRGAAVTWLTPARLLLVSYSDTGRLTVFDTTGSTVRLAAGPLLGPDSIPHVARLRASQNVRVCDEPGSARFALLFSDAGRGDLFDSTLQHVGRLDVPFPSNGAFVYNTERRTWELHVPRRYYLSCASTAAYLYATFSGRRQEVGSTAFASSGRFVQVFSWNGRLVRVLELDHPAFGIAVDGDSVLYAISPQSDSVLEYRLPIDRQ